MKQSRGREEGWKEVVRTRYLASPYRSKKVSVPLNAISRVIGRGGSNINAIRASTGALIEVDNQSKGQGERIITIKLVQRYLLLNVCTKIFASKY